MSIGFSGRLIQFYRSLDTRIRELPAGTRKARASAERARGSLRSWILIVAGLCLGLLGYTLVSREAEIAWLKKHAPPRLIWEKALTERGFHEVTDERALFDLQSRLPLTGENVSRVHILENRRAVFLRIGQDSFFFSHGSKAPPSFYREDWQRLGYGWDAFDAFQKLDFPSIPTPAPATPHRVRVPVMDPRELRY